MVDVLGEMLQDVGVIHFEELGLSQQQLGVESQWIPRLTAEVLQREEDGGFSDVWGEAVASSLRDEGKEGSDICLLLLALGQGSHRGLVLQEIDGFLDEWLKELYHLSLPLL